MIKRIPGRFALLMALSALLVLNACTELPVTTELEATATDEPTEEPTVEETEATTEEEPTATEEPEPTATDEPTPTAIIDTSALTIMDIQGRDMKSPLEGEEIETTGIVTLYTANGAHFWLQDPEGDGDPLTSDGIFVTGGGNPDSGERPEVGDLIRIAATVDEQQFAPAVPLTRLREVTEVEILSSGNDLPEPVMLTDLPDTSMVEGMAFWEPLEGMLVTVENAIVVAPTNQFGEFTMVAEGDQVPGSGYYAENDHLLISSLGDEEVDYNPERIMVDDSPLDEALIMLPGDLVYSLTGTVDFTFGNYKLQPMSWDIEQQELPLGQVSQRTGEAGNLTVTTFNVENLFDLIDEPRKDDGTSTPTEEELETHLTKLALAIEVELELPAILAVQEVENEDILQLLGNRVNANTGTNYVASSLDASDGRGIETGFLWDADRVNLTDYYFIEGEDVEDAFGPGSLSAGREPLVGVFEVQGQELIIINNHFRSKGGDDPLYRVSWPPDRISEIQRDQQAQVVRDFLDTLFADDPDLLVLVTGDMNDFQFAEPGEGDHPLGILEGSGDQVPMYDLINEVEDAFRYTYVYDGNSQVLDHMLVSPALRDLLAGVDILHFNAGYPNEFQSDPTTVFHVSDHDPIEARFDFGE